MVHILLPTDCDLIGSKGTKSPRLSFFLAMEEFVAKELKQFDECFFAWQVEPTVIFGRNQLVYKEVNLDYCKANNIDIIRRKSGGGCVYADMNNLMFSYINTGWDVTLTFDHYLHLLVDMLHSLGIEAQYSSRNDITIDGRKVSGNAFYHVSNRNIVHGTMLYDTNMTHMVNAITPSTQKLTSKGVESVRQHITLLKDYIGQRYNIDEFRNYACDYLCSSTYTLSQHDISVILEIQKEYHTPNYIMGNNPPFSFQRDIRLDGVGEFNVNIEVKNNIIRNINLLGDFFLVGDLNEMLLNFKGVPYNKDSIQQVAVSLNTSKVILGLTPQKLTQILAR